MEKQTNPIISRRFALVLYVVAAAAAIGGLVVNVTSVFGWTIDATSVGLIGVLLLVPIAEHLRKLKIGSVEAEFAETVDYLGRRVAEFTDLATEPSEQTPDPSRILGDDDQEPPSRAINRIVWVDDQPAGNRLEVAEMQRRFYVVTATSTAEGLSQVSKSPDDTAVITDAVRTEGGKESFNAGRKLIEALRQRYGAIPVYVFCGQGTAEDYAEPLVRAGARIVTASFTELARKVRADARMFFMRNVVATLGEVGRVEAQDHGIDFFVRLGEKRIGVEAKDYHRTRELHAVDRAVQQLADAIAAGR
jgi:CheY-like chemotaxis protein